MKKRMLILAAAVLSAAGALGYKVNTAHNPFYFENQEVKIRTQDGAGWLQGNTIYNVNPLNDLTDSNSTPSRFYIGIEKPGVAVKGWGISTLQNIGNASWDYTASTNYSCSYNSAYKEYGNVYLYVWLKWMRYGITFESNGGSAVEPLSNICYTNSIALPTPSRTGYDFLGWTNSTLTAAITGEQTGAELQVQEDGETVVLYAKWAPKTFTVTFNPNGEGATVDPAEKSVTYDSVYGPLPTPVWAGHGFTGWFTDTTFDTQIQSNTVVSITADQTLYARWGQLYTVSFEYLGGGIIKQYTDVPFGSRVEPPDISEVNVPEGKRFTGQWESSEYENVTRNLVILPKFYDIETILTVTCDPTAGGKCEISNNGSGLYEYGRTATLTVTAYEAYDFAGWSDGSMDNPYNVRVISNTNLTARFTLKKLTVNFMDRDGTTTNATRIVEYNSAASAPSPVEHLGYTFKGWSADFSHVISNMTVVAQYEINRYTVSYNANGGSTPTSSQTVTYGEAYGELPTPTWAHHNFSGWFTASSGGTKVEPTDIVQLTGDITLYAQWTLEEHSVTFYDMDDTMLLSTNVAYGSAVDAPSPVEHLGYTFKEWSADFSHVISNMTVVAQYAANRYTVVYDANGGTGSMTNDVVTYGQEYSIRSNDYTRTPVEIWDFAGWATNATATTNEVVYYGGETVSNLTAVANGTNIFYAVWRSLLSDLSVAADCDNLILECPDENYEKWDICNTSGFESDTSVCAKGALPASMVATLSGSGTLTFSVKVLSSETPDKVLNFWEYPGATGDTGIKGQLSNQKTNTWIKCEFRKDSTDEVAYEWWYRGKSNTDECWIDQVHWYPGKRVTVQGNDIDLSVKNEVTEAILQNWDAILGASATSVSNVVAKGPVVTNAVALLKGGYRPEVDTSTVPPTLTFNEVVVSDVAISEFSVTNLPAATLKVLISPHTALPEVGVWGAPTLTSGWSQVESDGDFSRFAAEGIVSFEFDVSTNRFFKVITK